jgi:hypothetical protein
MTVLDQLACSLKRRDEAPNQALARRLASERDWDGVAEIAANLSNPNPAVRADCIKVLYETGYLAPDLIAPYALDFVKLLKSRNNRLVWGGMIALAVVAPLAAEALYLRLADIQKAFQNGSVITRDAGVQALANIAAANPTYNAHIFPQLLEHLRFCRPKEVAQHSEKTLPAVNADNKSAFIAVLEKRLEDLQGSQVVRVKKVLRQAQQK